MSYKVLLVDDDSLVRIGLKSIIDWKSKGFEVVGEASDGKEALRKIEGLKPDIVITDMYMPNYDGLQLVSEARAAFPETLFLVLSCHNNINYVKESMRLGVYDYLLKSSIVDSNEMEMVLNKMSATLEERRLKVVASSGTNSAELYLSDNEFSALLLLYLNGQKDHYERIKWYLQKKKIDTDSENFFLVALQIDNFSKHGAALRESVLFEDAIQNMLEKIIDEFGGGIVIRSDEHVFFVLFNVVTKNNFISPKDKALCIGERFRISVKNNLKTTCSIYVDEGRDLDGLPDTYVNIMQEINANRKLYYDTIVNLTGSDPSIYKRLTEEEDDNIPLDPINSVLEYIHQHYRSQITLDDLARVCSFSKYHLCKKFKEKTKTSINNYILMVRIDKAKEMLLQNKHKIFVIAQDVGFNDTPYFNRMFKKLTGYTPTEFMEYNNSMM